MTKVFTPTDSRARIADWMEVQALVSTRRVTSAQMIRAVNIIDDPERDEEDEDRAEDPEDDEDVRGDRDILNLRDENLSIRVFDEIAYRADVLGENYPFELSVAGQNWSITARPIDPSSPHGLARAFYAVALLITAVKYEYVSLDEEHKLGRSMPELMQIMAVLVAAEYIGGEVYWMGWPRPEQSPTFLDAVRNFISKIAVGRLISDNTAFNSSTVRDGSVDLIAWRSFKDGKPGKAVMYGQVASGKNWRDKPLHQSADPNFMGWFQNGPTRERLYSMFIPFVQHEDCKPRRGQVYDTLQQDLAERDEREMGIIFDRLRIAELASLVHPKVAALSADTEIDFLLYIDRINAWRLSVLTEVAQSR